MVSCVVSLFLQAIPKEAFVKDLSAATYYLVRDLAGAALGLAGLFAIQDLELQPVAYWSASAFCWMIEGEAVSFFPLPIGRLLVALLLLLRLLRLLLLLWYWNFFFFGF